MADRAPDSELLSLGNDPVVTVAIPMLNELGAIKACLDSFAAQDYPHELLDVLVIDAGSTDGSRDYVNERAARESWVRVIDNPIGSAAAAFNLGAREGTGQVVCLFSAEGVPSTDYVSRSVKVLLETGVVGVGGRYHHLGTTPVSRSIGMAMVSPFGMASAHRMARTRKVVDNISHPAYVRQALLDVGGFDETLARNSDYELNVRLRHAGHLLMFDPSIESIYRPRPTLEALGRQFWHYGRWKARIAKQHPGDTKPRHLIAPALTIAAAATPLALTISRPLRLLTASSWLTYIASCMAAGLHAGRSGPDHSRLTLFASFPVMHFSWGAGYVTSTLADLLSPKKDVPENR